MRRNWYCKLIGLALCAFMVFSGCRLKREIPVKNIETTGGLNSVVLGNSLHVTGEMWSEQEVDRIVQSLWNVGIEDAVQYKIKAYYASLEKHGLLSEDYYYERGYETLSIAKTADFGTGWIEYCDEECARASCYSFFNIHGYLNEGLGHSMSSFFPEKELANYSSEEALSFCHPFAASCGYKEDEVQVFAMTKERLKAICDENGMGQHAPDPEYHKTLSANEKYELLDELTMALENDDQERQQQINEQLLHVDEIHDFPWTEKDEAYLLIYQPKLNGLTVESYSQMLEVIYVPALKKIVYAKGYRPLTVTSMDEVQLVPQEQAISAAILSLGMEENEDFQLIDTKLAYWVRAIEFGGDDPVLRPCWKVDYWYPNMYMKDAGTILIDATTGLVGQFSEQG